MRRTSLTDPFRPSETSTRGYCCWPKKCWHVQLRTPIRTRWDVSRSALFDGGLSRVFEGVPVPVPARCRALRESEPGNELGERPLRPGGGEAHAGHPAGSLPPSATSNSARHRRPSVTILALPPSRVGGAGSDRARSSRSRTHGRFPRSGHSARRVRAVARLSGQG